MIDWFVIDSIFHLLVCYIATAIYLNFKVLYYCMYKVHRHISMYSKVFTLAKAVLRAQSCRRSKLICELVLLHLSPKHAAEN